MFYEEEIIGQQTYFRTVKDGRWKLKSNASFTKEVNTLHEQIEHLQSIVESYESDMDVGVSSLLIDQAE